MNIFFTILTSLVSSGILVWVFKEWLSTRLRTSIQHEYDRKLESLKADLSREAAFHAAAHSSFAEGQKAAMERKLAAIDRLWQSLIGFKLPESKSVIVSQIISATIDSKLIKPDEKAGGSRKFARYIPYWA